jgi:tryptophan 2,3-dioxygenase
MSKYKNYREVEKSICINFNNTMSYTSYLNINELLKLQNTISESSHEMMFIIIHQISELWIKLINHELISAIKYIRNNELKYVFKIFNRVKSIQIQLISIWNVLSTLTPIEYIEFRSFLSKASGFQSYGYRKLEFLLGNKNEKIVELFKNNNDIYMDIKNYLNEPSLYDEIIKLLKVNYNFNICDTHVNRIKKLPYESNSSVLESWSIIYNNIDKYYDLYQLGESLVDIEDNFQKWRFYHLRTVQRIINGLSGTGGSSGVPFLKKALDICFFPELYEIRNIL